MDEDDDYVPPSKRRRASKGVHRQWVLFGLLLVVTPCAVLGVLAMAAAKLLPPDTAKQSATQKATDPAPAPKVWTRGEFQRFVVGQHYEKLLKTVGTPRSTSEAGGTWYWYYRYIVRDEITGKLDYQTQVIIENGVVMRVNF